MKTIAHREQASSTIQVDNERVRVTEYTFESGAETTFSSSRVGLRCCTTN